MFESSILLTISSFLFLLIISIYSLLLFRSSLGRPGDIWIKKIAHNRRNLVEMHYVISDHLLGSDKNPKKLRSVAKTLFLRVSCIVNGFWDFASTQHAALLSAYQIRACHFVHHAEFIKSLSFEIILSATRLSLTRTIFKQSNPLSRVEENKTFLIDDYSHGTVTFTSVVWYNRSKIFIHLFVRVWLLTWECDDYYTQCSLSLLRKIQ